MEAESKCWSRTCKVTGCTMLEKISSMAGGTQTARGDAGNSVREQAKVKTGNRDITKAVLASPLVIPWPNIPRNHQMAVMKELTRLVPDTIAAYHTSRARCQVERKKATRKRARLSKGKEGDEGMAVDLAQSELVEKETTIENPVKPEILDNMVLGINETIKSLETAIDDLKLRLLMITDRMSGIHLKPKSNLLPTAPKNPERSPSPDPTPTSASPPAFIVIPLQSISPQSLVSPIPQYAATYNSLVWQWGQLSRIAKTRIKEAEWEEVIGEDREEVRVVPLGRVEGEMAALVGLRRLACLAIRRSHPQLALLEKILPKSVLHPPRHALTLPYPTSNLKVHNDDTQTAPLPHVHYAPVTIKGITTSTPVDANSKKKVRLAEVRQKRVEAKIKRKAEREGGTKAKGKSVSKKKAAKAKQDKPGVKP